MTVFVNTETLTVKTLEEKVSCNILFSLLHLVHRRSHLGTLFCRCEETTLKQYSSATDKYKWKQTISLTACSLIVCFQCVVFIEECLFWPSVTFLLASCVKCTSVLLLERFSDPVVKPSPNPLKLHLANQNRRKWSDQSEMRINNFSVSSDSSQELVEKKIVFPLFPSSANSELRIMFGNRGKWLM